MRTDQPSTRHKLPPPRIGASPQPLGQPPHQGRPTRAALTRKVISGGNLGIRMLDVARKVISGWKLGLGSVVSFEDVVSGWNLGTRIGGLTRKVISGWKFGTPALDPARIVICGWKIGTRTEVPAERSAFGQVPHGNPRVIETCAQHPPGTPARPGDGLRTVLRASSDNIDDLYNRVLRLANLSLISTTSSMISAACP